MGDAEQRAFGLVGQALDFPTMRENDLLHDGQAEAGSLFVRGKVRLKNLQALMLGHSIRFFQEHLQGKKAP